MSMGFPASGQKFVVPPLQLAFSSRAARDPRSPSTRVPRAELHDVRAAWLPTRGRGVLLAASSLIAARSSWQQLCQHRRQKQWRRGRTALARTASRRQSEKATEAVGLARAAAASTEQEGARAEAANDGLLPAAQARAFLLCTSALWGTYPICVKLLGQLPGAPEDPVLITALRFGIMALASGPVVASASGALAELGGGDRMVAFVSAASELGLWGTMGTVLNTWGLERIGAVRGALLLSSINILTPVLSRFFGQTAEERDVPLRAWLACGVALMGTVIATLGDVLMGGPPSAVSAPLGLGLGECAVLGAASCYAAVKVRLGSLVQGFPAEALASGRLITQAVLAILILAVDESGSAGIDGAASDLQNTVAGIPVAAWAVLTVSALASGVGASVLQAKGQKVIKAAEAQPIYAMVPLFAAAYAFFVIGEPIEQKEVLGGALVVLAAVVSSWGAEPDDGETGERSTASL